MPEKINPVSTNRVNVTAWHPVPAHIDTINTILRFGHDPHFLKPNSQRQVIASCSLCGKERIKFYREAIAQRLCLRCSNVKIAKDENTRNKQSQRMKKFYADGGKHHLKGIGHTAATKEKMSKNRMGVKLNLTETGRQNLIKHCLQILNNPDTKKKTIALNKLRCGVKNPAFGRPPAHTRKVWYVNLTGEKICFRSSWELKFALYLDKNQIKWEYEPQTFIVDLPNKKGSYTPDFKTGHKFFEVKGLWTKEGKEKFDAFIQQYPEFTIEVVDRNKMKELGLL